MSAASPLGERFPAAVGAPPRGAKRPALRRFMRHRLAMFGLAAIVFLVLACVIGHHIAQAIRPHSIYTQRAEVRKS